MHTMDSGVGRRVFRPNTAEFVARVFLRASAAMLAAAASAALVVHNVRMAALLFEGDTLTELGWIVILLPLPLAIALDRIVESLSLAAARLTLLVWSLAIGASLAGALHLYAQVDILAAFVGAAAGFAMLALVGSAAQGHIGRPLLFAISSLVGVLAATTLNLIFGSPTLDIVVAGAGVIVFSALAAFDIQRIERLYEGGLRFAEAEERLAMVGALTLSLDFLNLLLSLLRLTTRRR